MKDTLNVNFFAGPGVGKSRTTAAVYSELKLRDYNAEQTQEYAKELVYAEDWFKLEDQLLIAGEQHHRMLRLQNKVQVAVHDSPFIMGVTYAKDHQVSVPHFNDLLMRQFNRYNNLNILLIRNDDLEYKEEGRMQDKAGAKEKDRDIEKLLQSNGIKYHKLLIGESTIDNACDLIEKQYSEKTIMYGEI